jgi:hypothetical protein
MFFTRQFYNGDPIIPLQGSAAMRIQYSDIWNGDGMYH